MILPAVAMSRRNADAYPVSSKLRNKLLVYLGWERRGSCCLKLIFLFIMTGLSADLPTKLVTPCLGDQKSEVVRHGYKNEFLVS